MMSDLELFAFVSGLIIVTVLLFIAFINIKVGLAEVKHLYEMRRVCTKQVILSLREVLKFDSYYYPVYSYYDDIEYMETISHYPVSRGEIVDGKIDGWVNPKNPEQVYYRNPCRSKAIFWRLTSGILCLLVFILYIWRCSTWLMR